MSQLYTAPLFDACCSGQAAATVSSNPNLFYDATKYADPNAAGLVPANPALPCVAFEASGNGGMYVWNATAGTWNRN